MTELIAWTGAIVAFLTAGGLVQKYLFRPAWKFIRAVQRFLSDFNGEPERPGVPRRPGVLERLERIEWHVGNGSPVALRTIVLETQASFEDHKVEAGERDRLLAELARRIDRDGGPHQAGREPPPLPEGDP